MEELNLRASVAALARVLADDPETGQTLLVLERAATVQDGPDGPALIVRAKPYGGAVRLRDVGALRAAIGDFHFDSARSREEGDFRIVIREADWPQLQAFCLLHLPQQDGVLETSPERELAEELRDSLKIGALPEQPWTLAPLGIVIEALPTPTASPRAPGLPTVRIYNVHEARLSSPALIEAALALSDGASDEDLRQQAWEDWRTGGKGRANAPVALVLDWLVQEYGKIPMDQRDGPLQIGAHLLDGNVPAILPEVETLKYRRRPALPALPFHDCAAHEEEPGPTSG